MWCGIHKNMKSPSPRTYRKNKAREIFLWQNFKSSCECICAYTQKNSQFFSMSLRIFLMVLFLCVCFFCESIFMLHSFNHHKSDSHTRRTKQQWQKMCFVCAYCRSHCARARKYNRMRKMLSDRWGWLGVRVNKRGRVLCNCNKENHNGKFTTLTQLINISCSAGRLNVLWCVLLRPCVEWRHKHTHTHNKLCG